jgi:hypothetical protein
MATSGTSVYERTRDELIGRALRIVGAFEAGETPDAASVNDAGTALNSLIKHWQGNGINIWSTQEAIVFLQIGQRQYTLSSTSTDHATASYVDTTLSADVATGASTITVESVTGIATTYHIGVQLDDGTLQWTTVNGAPVGTTVTLTAVLTDSASAGNLVVCYQTKLVRPLRIISARRYNFASGIETPLDVMDRIEYEELPNKGSESTVNGLYYDRRGGANSSGLLKTWPTPMTVDEALKVTVARPIEIFSTAGNNPDLPEEWMRTIEWGLADEIADEYDVPEPKRSRIEKRAASFLNDVTWWERELTEVQFAPDFIGR